MPSKRPISEVDGATGEDSHPHNGESSSNPTKRKRFEKKSAPKSKKSKKAESINSLKKRVRTIERRFKTGEALPPNVTADLQRELATHKSVIAEITLRKKRRDMISKYHMVRFFERRKAERLLKQLRRKAVESADADADADDKEKEDFQSQIHKAEVDLCYTRNYPYLEPYISLYPRDVNGAMSALNTERPPVWKEVEEAMAAGEAALENLRERNPQGGVVPRKLRDNKHEEGSPFQKQKDRQEKEKERQAKKEKKRELRFERKAAREAAEAESKGDAAGDESDGGFFE
ncbi:uncharacterized protein DNG_03296 [Cephalotrichum gorgonifer]|uniref:rRNA-processing protein EFG1 n=1 Tax=Cephalotrichum gorgonifer TaxID=2041049 RepID=A0AAE8MU03_9PEZI|nr:uncharacterized protein DNG_03296 [Cephalotrichum gorgonifer]